MNNLLLCILKLFNFQQIYGEESEIRAVPVTRNMVKIMYSAKESEEAQIMEGKWTKDSFTYLETKAMVDTINLIKKGQTLAQ